MKLKKIVIGLAVNVIICSSMFGGAVLIEAATIPSARWVSYCEECPYCGKIAYDSVETSCPICKKMVTRYYCHGKHSWTLCDHI